MWALIVDGKINRVFKVPTAFKHPTTGIQYPRNWLNLATDSEKASVGFIEITESGSYGESDYYDNSESNPVYDASKGTVVITKSKTAKDLAKIKIQKTYFGQPSFKKTVKTKRCSPASNVFGIRSIIRMHKAKLYCRWWNNIKS